MSAVQVLCGFDGNYLLPAAVTLKSLMAALGPDDRCVAHLVGLGVEERGRRRLEQAVEDPRLTVRWHHIDAATVGAVPRSHERAYLTESIYVRLFLDRFLPPDVERVIFLDVDTLVVDSVAELWSIDLGGQVLAAVRDLGTPTVSAPLGVGDWRALGLDGRAKYLNAGLLVIDRRAWREAELERRTLEYLRGHADHLVFNDQEALNACLAGEWLELPARWNAQVRELDSAYAEPNAPIFSFVPVAELDRSRDQPALVHFSGWRKPWMAEGADLMRADDWWDVARTIAWAPPRRTKPARPTAPDLARSVRRRLRRAAHVLRHG